MRCQDPDRNLLKGSSNWRASHHLREALSLFTITYGREPKGRLERGDWRQNGLRPGQEAGRELVLQAPHLCLKSAHE